MLRPRPARASTLHRRRKRYGTAKKWRWRKSIIVPHPSLIAQFDALRRAPLWRSEHNAFVSAWRETRRSLDVLEVLSVEHRRNGARYDFSNGSCDPATLDASIFDVMRVLSWSFESTLAASWIGMIPCLWVSDAVGFAYSLAAVARVHRGEWEVGAPPRANRAPQWRPLPMLYDRTFGFWDSPRRVVVAPWLELHD
jgi:hypothetical protein